MSKILNIAFFISLIAVINGCSTTSGQPVLKRNSHYNKVGRGQARKDIKQAIANAKATIESRKPETSKKVHEEAKKTAVSAGTGTVIRLATGSMAAGLATGGGTRTADKIRQRRQERKTFRQLVEENLRQKGYEIRYWR